MQPYRSGEIDAKSGVPEAEKDAEVRWSIPVCATGNNQKPAV